MNNIIHKTIKRTKFEFYKGLGLVEILVLSSWIVLASLFIFGLPIGRYWKILALTIGTLGITLGLSYYLYVRNKKALVVKK